MARFDFEGGTAWPWLEVAMKAYHVVQWKAVHETSESRKLAKLNWVAKPNKHDGLGYRQIVQQEDREALYAGWALILEVAGKAPQGLRGWLVRDGRPLSPIELALMTGFKKELFERALEFYSQEGMGWLEKAEVPSQPELELKLAGSAGVPGGSPGVPAGSAGSPGPSPAMTPVHNSTVPDSTGDLRGNNNRGAHAARAKRPGGAGEDPNGSAPKRAAAGSAVAASRTQFAALTAKIKDLEQRSEELTEAERSELVKKRAALEVLKSNQEAGKF